MQASALAQHGAACMAVPVGPAQLRTQGPRQLALNRGVNSWGEELLAFLPVSLSPKVKILGNMTLVQWIKVL